MKHIVRLSEVAALTKRYVARGMGYPDAIARALKDKHFPNPKIKVGTAYIMKDDPAVPGWYSLLMAVGAVLGREGGQVSAELKRQLHLPE